MIRSAPTTPATPMSITLESATLSAIRPSASTIASPATQAIGA